jgi:hypothetical protein
MIAAVGARTLCPEIQVEGDKRLAPLAQLAALKRKEA